MSKRAYLSASSSHRWLSCPPSARLCADNTLAPTAVLALNGQGEFFVGDHCQFCKVKATCRKRAEHNLELAKYDFAMPDMTLMNQNFLPL